VQLALHTGDDPQRLTKIYLSMTRGVVQWNEYLLRPAFLLSNIIRDNRQLSGEPMLVAQSFKYPLRRVALLLDNPLIVFKDLIDNRGKTVQLRADRGDRPAISRRHRMRQNLRDSLSIYPK